MLILKTTAKTRDPEKATVFDEIDAGIGGRVAEAVGLKLKQLASGAAGSLRDAPAAGCRARGSIISPSKKAWGEARRRS